MNYCVAEWLDLMDWLEKCWVQYLSVALLSIFCLYQIYYLDRITTRESHVNKQV
jgi:uncharacterized membrane protein